MEYVKSAMDSSSSRSGSGESGATTDIENISSSSKSPTSPVPSRQPSQFQSKPSVVEPTTDKRPPCVELFIGDLSFFCSERNLVELFSPYGKILEAVISRSDNGGHSLLHGFIKMSNSEEAEIAAAKLNDSPFMGRTLRVQVCSLDGATMVKPPRPGYHVHVSFAADAKVPNVTEEKLRSVFDQYGAISDVIVKRHSRMKNPPRQKGYGFVYFYSKEHAELAVSALNGKIVDDIIFECALSRKKEPDVVSGVGASHTQIQDGNTMFPRGVPSGIQEKNGTSSLKTSSQQAYRSVPVGKPTTHGSGSNSYASVQQVPYVNNQDYGMHQRGPHTPQFQMPVFSPEVVYYWPHPVSYDVSHMAPQHAQHSTMNQMHHANRTEVNGHLTSVSSVKEPSVKDGSFQQVSMQPLTNPSGQWVSTNSTEGVSGPVGMPLVLCGHPPIHSSPTMSFPGGRQNIAQQPVPQQYYGVPEYSTVVNTNPMQSYGRPPQHLPPKSTQPSSVSTNGSNSNLYVNQQDRHIVGTSVPYPPPQQNNIMQPRSHVNGQTNQYYHNQYGQNSY